MLEVCSSFQGALDFNNNAKVSTASSCAEPFLFLFLHPTPQGWGISSYKDAPDLGPCPSTNFIFFVRAFTLEFSLLVTFPSTSNNKKRSK